MPTSTSGTGSGGSSRRTNGGRRSTSPSSASTSCVRTSRLLDPILPLKAPEAEGNIYEYRNYRTAPGRVREWAKHFQAIMPVREEYSKNVGAWITEAGQPNEVSHLWAYPSVDARTERRAAVAGDPRWREFLGKAGPLLEEMHSTILLPAAHSPLR